MSNQVPRHHAIGLDAMLKAVELPTGVAKLDPSLTYVHTDNLSHLLLSLDARSLRIEQCRYQRCERSRCEREIRGGGMR